jgi:hypothetical protein
MPDHAGFAAAITVRESVLRIALQAGYANGSDSSRHVSLTLFGGPPALEVELFLGQPDIRCEGSSDRLILTLPLRGKVKVTKDQVETTVTVSGEMELAFAPEFRIADPGESSRSVVLNPNTDIVARRWLATITSDDAPADVAAIVTGDVFRTQFETTFRLGVQARQFALPSIDASFLGPLVEKAYAIEARVRDGALLIGFGCEDDGHSLGGNVEALQDFAGIYHVAAAIHPGAVDLFLDEVRVRIAEGAAAEGASLGNLSMVARDGHFRVSGSVNKSGATVTFSFRIVPRMFHTRPGNSFQYLSKPRWVNSRTWPALDFAIEGVDTNVDRDTWLVILGEVVGGIFTLGFATLWIEGLLASAESSLAGQIRAGSHREPNARVRRSIPPPGGVAVRIGLDHFVVTDSGVAIYIAVQARSSTALISGPITLPETYRSEALRYRLQLPSGVSQSDPELRIHWILRDLTNGVVLRDSDGPADSRLTLEFSPASSPATRFQIQARIYRLTGQVATTIDTRSTQLEMRPALPGGAYVRWRWEGKNPQVKLHPQTETWTYEGERRVRRYSNWHRTDTPCQAVGARARYRFDEEKLDRLPFPLKLLDGRRKGLCPYCFYGGPAGVSARL